MPIEELGAEYRNPFFGYVAGKLSDKGFDFLRLIRGDGNCYYRCVAYALIEKLSMTGKHRAFLEIAAM
jgi:hypothetical protein